MSEVKGEPSHGGLEDMEIDDPRIYEEELEDVRRSALYSLLLVNYDYFEHEVLGRAQGEYRFLKETDKEWRAQKKGEVQPSKFNLDQFRGMGSHNRPVYLVIKTILEHARNTQHAEAAAEEYMRLRSMEKKLSKQFPRDFELEEKKVTESMVQRYRCPSGRFLRQAAEFKMVLLDEYNKLKETIDHQRNQISELSSRLSGITNQQIADGEIFTDIGDRNTPRMLGRRFGDVFEDQWTSAYETLKPRTGPAPKGEDDKEEYDLEVIVKLQDIVQMIYSFCKKTAEHQVNRLIGVMIPPIEDPLQNRDKGGSAKPSDDTSIQTERMARDFRKAMAPATVPLLQQEMETRIKESKIVPDPLTKEIKEYINTLVNIVWYMCIQQQPMEIIWGEKGKKFNKEQFRYSGKKGQKFGLTVWPAVLYHSEGPLASAGYAIPE